MDPRRIVRGGALLQTRDDAAWAEIETLARDLEQRQLEKVTELGRRLRAGLTPEDLRNPHDFPELDDGAFQYEDGVLAGIKTVLAAIRARRAEGQAR